jgi:hypothetical protein
VSVADPTVLPACIDILAALRVELAKVPAGAPTHFRHVPGLAAVVALTVEVDECCEGVAWVRLTGIYPTDDFPVEQSQWLPEGEVSWSVEVEIGVVRCSRTSPGADMAPTDADYLADVTVITDDAAALRRVGPNMKLNPNARIIDYQAGRWDPVEAAGGCMGGAMKLSVQVEACDAGQAG